MKVIDWATRRLAGEEESPRWYRDPVTGQLIYTTSKEMKRLEESQKQIDETIDKLAQSWLQKTRVSIDFGRGPTLLSKEDWSKWSRERKKE